MKSKRFIFGLAAILAMAISAQEPIYASTKAKKKNSQEKHHKKYDVIIIGAGTAGAVAAKYISDDPRMSVLVLEQGANQNENPFVKFPFTNSDPDNEYGFGFNLVQPAFNPRTTDSVEAADVPARSGNDQGFWTWNNNFRQGSSHTGRNWGGAQAHNYLSDYWESAEYDALIELEYGGPDWGPDAMYQIKKDLETYQTVDSTTGRGTNGPMIITKAPDGAPSYIDDIQDALVDPAVNGIDTALSAPKVSDLNSSSFPTAPTVTVRAKQLNQFIKQTFERTHAGESFLGPDVVDQNTGLGVNGRKLKIINNALVNRVLFKNRVAKKVEVIINGKTKCFSAGRKIIICAGGLRSPGILERSGIGDANILQAQGIDVVQHNPNVGNNYMNQMAVVAFVKIDEELAASRKAEVAFLAYPGGGPQPITRITTHRTIAGPLAAFEPYFPDRVFAAQYGVNYDALNTIANLCYDEQPYSRGSIHITTKDPLTPPQHLRKFLTDPRDIDWAVKILQLNHRMEVDLAVRNPGLNYETLLPPQGVDYEDENEVLEWAKALSFPTDHHMGTCAMGKSVAAGGVVNGKLHVYGVRNLMVADGSVLPIPPDSSPAYLANVIGKQAANFVLESLDN